jgi:hypothetical protein
MEALSSSETSVLTRSTQRNIPGDTILHSYRRGNLKSYTVGRILWMGDQSVIMSLTMHKRRQALNQRGQISMSRVGFEPTDPELEGEKAFHALDCEAIAIGGYLVLKLV